MQQVFPRWESHGSLWGLPSSLPEVQMTPPNRIIPVRGQLEECSLGIRSKLLDVTSPDPWGPQGLPKRESCSDMPVIYRPINTSTPGLPRRGVVSLVIRFETKFVDRNRPRPPHGKDALTKPGTNSGSFFHSPGAPTRSPGLFTTTHLLFWHPNWPPASAVLSQIMSTVRVFLFLPNPKKCCLLQIQCPRLLINSCL